MRILQPQGGMIRCRMDRNLGILFNFVHWFFVHFNLDNMEVIVRYLKSVSRKKIEVTKCPRSLNQGKALAMAICPIIAHFITDMYFYMYYTCIDAWCGMWIHMLSKEAQK